MECTGVQGFPRVTSVYSVAMDGPGNGMYQLTGITDMEFQGLSEAMIASRQSSLRLSLTEVWDDTGAIVTRATFYVSDGDPLRAKMGEFLHQGYLDLPGLEVSAAVSHFVGKPSASMQMTSRRGIDLKERMQQLVGAHLVTGDDYTVSPPATMVPPRSRQLR